MKPRFTVGAADRSGNSWTEAGPFARLRQAQERAAEVRNAMPYWAVFVIDEEEPERGDLSSEDAEEYHERWGIK